MPNLGDIGLVRMRGTVGRLIRAGQWLDGDGYEDYEHAVVCVGFETHVHNGTKQLMAKCVGAMPSGARYQLFGATDGVLWSAFELTDKQRALITEAAIGYVGTKYSFADYAAIAMHRFHLDVPGLKDYIADSKHMICSQLADQCYRDAGVQLFKDGRWPGYVTPGALYGLIEGKRF